MRVRQIEKDGENKKKNKRFSEGVREKERDSFQKKKTGFQSIVLGNARETKLVEVNRRFSWFTVPA